MPNSPNEGIVQFYYTQTLPSEAIAIARIQASEYTPADLVTINNSVFDQGTLSVWKSLSPLSGPADFTAPDINQTISINGDSTYLLGNQFFELTNIVSADNTPLYYEHVLPTGISSANILDASGNILSVEMLIQNNVLYHSQSNAYYQVRYVDSAGFVQETMLLFNPVLAQSQYTASQTLYTFSANQLTVFNSGIYYLRFTALNGYQVMPPYNVLSNVPWFIRIRYGLLPTPPEWALQSFIPYRPYLLATWATGAVLNSSTIQFERTNIYYNPNQAPDILVFDSTNKIKYALDGTAVGVVSTKGFEYPWKQGLISAVDDYTGRVTVGVDLDPTDLVYGFYSYREKDIVYTAVDVNPFTNPLVKNGQVTFYFKNNGQDPTKYLYYTLQDSSGNVLQTNDTSPSTGANHIFAQVVVGANVSTDDLIITDIRQRGGGLAPSVQNIAEASNFWDLGYWDGKPYPVAGAMIVYLPQSLLTSLSAAEIESRIQSIVPLGEIPIIKYYDNKGNEF